MALNLIDAVRKQRLDDRQEVPANPDRVADGRHLVYETIYQGLEVERRVLMNLPDDLNVMLVGAGCLHQDKIVSLGHEDPEAPQARQDSLHSRSKAFGFVRDRDRLNRNAQAGHRTSLSGSGIQRGRRVGEGVDIVSGAQCSVMQRCGAAPNDDQVDTRSESLVDGAKESLDLGPWKHDQTVANLSNSDR